MYGSIAVTPFAMKVLQLYCSPPISWARAFFCTKIDGFVQPPRYVDLRIVGRPEYLRLVDSCITQLLYIVYCRLLGPVVHSFRALSGHLTFTVRRHKFNKDSLPLNMKPWALNLTSHKVFWKSFCRSRLPHKSINLSFTITNENIENKLTDLCANWLVQNVFQKTLCERRSHTHPSTNWGT